jgi:hypothetical protein
LFSNALFAAKTGFWQKTVNDFCAHWLHFIFITDDCQVTRTINNLCLQLHTSFGLNVLFSPFIFHVSATWSQLQKITDCFSMVPVHLTFYLIFLLILRHNRYNLMHLC